MKRQIRYLAAIATSVSMLSSAQAYIGDISGKLTFPNPGSYSTSSRVEEAMRDAGYTRDQYRVVGTHVTREGFLGLRRVQHVQVQLLGEPSPVVSNGIGYLGYRSQQIEREGNQTPPIENVLSQMSPAKKKEFLELGSSLSEPKAIRSRAEFLEELRKAPVCANHQDLQKSAQRIYREATRARARMGSEEQFNSYLKDYAEYARGKSDQAITVLELAGADLAAVGVIYMGADVAVSIAVLASTFFGLPAEIDQIRKNGFVQSIKKQINWLVSAPKQFSGYIESILLGEDHFNIGHDTVEAHKQNMLLYDVAMKDSFADRAAVMTQRLSKLDQVITEYENSEEFQGLQKKEYDLTFGKTRARAAEALLEVVSARWESSRLKAMFYTALLKQLPKDCK